MVLWRASLKSMASGVFTVPLLFSGAVCNRAFHRSCFIFLRKSCLRSRSLTGDQGRGSRFSCLTASGKKMTTSLALPQETPYQSLFPKLLGFSAFYRRLKKAEHVIAIILILFQSSFVLPSSTWDTWFISPANAVLYSPDTKVPRTGELALRRAIPANANMKAIQDSLEEISYLLRIPQRKPYGKMEGYVKKALKIAMEQKESILVTLPEELKEKGSLLFASLTDGKGGLKALVEFIKENDPDEISIVLQSSLDTLAELELLQAPGLSFLLPEQYLKYPRLVGRGVVNFVIEKSDGSTFFPSAGRESKNFATIRVVLDGYSAPLTAGNFAKLAGLGGLSFDEGLFSVFGYTTDGRDLLSQIKTGDLIRSAKLVQGEDRLILSEQT